MLLLLYGRDLAVLLLDALLHYFHYNLQFWRLLNPITKIYFGLKSTLQRSPSKVHMFVYGYMSALPFVQNIIWNFLKQGKKNNSVCVCKL